MDKLILIGFIGLAFWMGGNAQTDCRIELPRAERNFELGKYSAVIQQLSGCGKDENFTPNDQRKLTKLKCQASYELSKTYFDKGQFVEVIDQLEGCVNTKKYSRPVKRDILRLVAETYQFLDEEEKAVQTYADLLWLDPFYTFSTGSPEVIYLREKFETYPFTAYTLYGNLNAFTRPTVIESFALNEITKTSEDYSRNPEDLFSWSVGLAFDINIDNSNVFLSTGYFFSSHYFRYNGVYQNALNSQTNTRGVGNITLVERHRWSQFPLLLKWMAAPKEKIIRRKIIPYFYAGASFEFLHRKSAQIQSPQISFEGMEDTPTPIATFSIGDRRVNFSTGFIAGLGVKYHIKRLYLDFDLRYHQFFRNLVEDTDRFQPSPLIDVLNYVDNDFRIYNIGLNVGVGFFLFKSRQTTFTE